MEHLAHIGVPSRTQPIPTEQIPLLNHKITIPLHRIFPIQERQHLLNEPSLIRIMRTKFREPKLLAPSKCLRLPNERLERLRIRIDTAPIRAPIPMNDVEIDLAARARAHELLQPLETVGLTGGRVDAHTIAHLRGAKLHVPARKRRHVLFPSTGRRAGRQVGLISDIGLVEAEEVGGATVGAIDRFLCVGGPGAGGLGLERVEGGRVGQSIDDLPGRGVPVPGPGDGLAGVGAEHA